MTYTHRKAYIDTNTHSHAHTHTHTHTLTHAHSLVNSITTLGFTEKEVRPLIQKMQTKALVGTMRIVKTAMSLKL